MPGGGNSTVVVSGRARQVVILVVACIGFLTLAAGVWLWPRGPLPKEVNAAAAAQQTITAEVVSVKSGRCPGLPDDRLPNGQIPAAVSCAVLGVRLPADAPGGDGGRVVPVQVGGSDLQNGVAPGAQVEVTPLPGDGNTVTYAWSDFSRKLPLTLLAAVFVVLVLAVARLRGAAALAGLGLGALTVVFFMLPALRHGENPALVGLVGSVAIMVVILYLAHGVSMKTTTAFVGTVAGLVVTAALAAWAAAGAHMSGATGPDRQLLTQIVGPSSVAAVVLCGFVLAGLGVLNDVTVTQASAVWELRAAAPELGIRQLFGRGMRIGRDHLASTVYTIAFAYAGAALPSILLITLYKLPLSQVLTTGDIAEEVVRTLVGSIGLILAIPLTTAIAACVAAAADTVHDPVHHSGQASAGPDSSDWPDRPDGQVLAHTSDVPGPRPRLSAPPPLDPSRVAVHHSTLPGTGAVVDHAASAGRGPLSALSRWWQQKERETAGRLAAGPSEQPRGTVTDRQATSSPAPSVSSTPTLSFPSQSPTAALQSPVQVRRRDLRR